jgi:hypothetical protein
VAVSSFSIVSAMPKRKKREGKEEGEGKKGGERYNSLGKQWSTAAGEPTRSG